MPHCSVNGSLDVSDLLLYSYCRTVLTGGMLMTITSTIAGPTEAAHDGPVATTWQVDPTHSHAEFAVRHLMISTVKGRFAEVTGTLIGDDTDAESASIELTIPVAGID